MPFIKSKVSCEMTTEQELALKRRFGKAIELVPGKSEEYLLLELEDSCCLWLRGERAAPIAYIEAAIFGNEGHFGYDAFTAEITKAFTEVLGIPSDRVYIKYEDITAWGGSGQYIDRRMFGG